LKKTRQLISPDGTSSALVLKMPVEASERAMLLTFVLQEQGALLNAKLLQVSATKTNKLGLRFVKNIFAEKFCGKIGALHYITIRLVNAKNITITLPRFHGKRHFFAKKW
jgi:hypothetical protein